jgi:hypothetical protein
MSNLPPPIVLAHRLTPLLAGLEWGIGGSTLLFHLGLETAPADLDIVTTPAQFDELEKRLSQHLGPSFRPSHRAYRSLHFAKFRSSAGVGVDVMADIAVRLGSALEHWQFDPQTITHADGLPWMRAADWVVLYRLFQRPARVSQLTAYLARSGN